MSTDKDKDKPEDKTLQGVKVFFAEGHLDAISVTALIAAVKVGLCFVLFCYARARAELNA
jgi:hypothetical protein